MGGRSKPVEMATRSFEKEGDATAFFKAMLNCDRPGKRVAIPRGRPDEAAEQSVASATTCLSAVLTDLIGWSLHSMKYR